MSHYKYIIYTLTATEVYTVYNLLIFDLFLESQN